MTALHSQNDELVRSRTVSWRDPAATRRSLAGQDGYERLLAIMRGEAAPPPAAAVLGMELIDMQRGRTTFALPVDEMHENPMGTMHGGIIATLVDSAMGCAVSSLLPADAAFTTLQLNTNFLRPITDATGVVTAEGWVVHEGSRVAMTEAQVRDLSGTLYAHATSTCMITRKQKEPRDE